MLGGLSSFLLAGISPSVAPSVSDKAAGRSKASDWEVSLGPLSFGSAGVDLKPQMKIGAKSHNFSVEAGMSDVRNGLRIGMEAEAKLEATASGHSLEQLHNSIRCQTPGFDQALTAAKSLLPDGTHKGIAEKIAPIAEKIGVSPEHLERIFAGEGLTDREPMTLFAKVTHGVGWNAQACLGWRDTQGYHMVGVGGEVRVALSFAASVFAGKHTSGKTFKIILGVTNFTFEYSLPLPPKLDASTLTTVEPVANALGANSLSLPAASTPHVEATDNLDLLGYDLEYAATDASNVLKTTSKLSTSTRKRRDADPRHRRSKRV